MKRNIPFVLDNWQKSVLKAEGNLCINSGRQVGKSQTIAIKVSEYGLKNVNKNILIVSITEDQAEMMIQKILLFLNDNARWAICKGKKRPTKHKIELMNGSVIRCKAVGQYGLGILGMTIDVLVCDEAAYMPEAVWAAATPMLLTTGGWLWLLSTPNAKAGYFYEAYTNDKMGFKTFHVNSEEVAESRPEPMKTRMLTYLASEKARMTDLNYAQQYLAQFLEELGQLFSDDLIRGAQVLDRLTEAPGVGEYYLGVDVARLGGDECTFEVLEVIDDVLYQRENFMFKYVLTTETIDKVLELDRKYCFKKIYIDDGGLGVAVFDQLLVNQQTKRKVVAINNASRSIDIDDSRHKKLLKEDLYFNFKNLLEKGKVKLLRDLEVFTSFKSIVLEHSSKTNDVRIYGSYSHIVEGLIRAAWCVKDKGLRLFYEVN